MMKCFKSTMLVAALVGCVGAWAAGNGNGNGHGTERGNGADHPVRTQTPAEAMGNPQGLSGRPGSAKGLLKLNQHVYYAGDTLQVRVVYPRSLQAIWSGDARGHLVVYVPTGAPVTVPLPATVPNQPIQVLDLTNLDTSQFAEGNYQIALVLTAPEGDPLKLGDWYAGFRGLLSVEQFKIRASATTPTPNTEVEGDTDGEMWPPAPQMTSPQVALAALVLELARLQVVPAVLRRVALARPPQAVAPTRKPMLLPVQAACSGASARAWLDAVR